MTSSYQPIVEVAPAPDKPTTLSLRWRDGSRSTVDLSRVIGGNAHLSPLAEPALFARARVSPEGFAVEWTDELDLSASQLWRWAKEQAGDAMAPADFRDWMQRHGLSLSSAVTTLGLSRRMVAYYANGEKLVPKTVLLACAGVDALARTRGSRQRRAPGLRRKRSATKVEAAA